MLASNAKVFKSGTPATQTAEPITDDSSVDLRERERKRKIATRTQICMGSALYCNLHRELATAGRWRHFAMCTVITSVITAM